uniref:Uncharacterized protein n=1 Tax=Anguilla anguilla TaxID=7936 RepID=A0A0E9ULA0_ANGAN
MDKVEQKARSLQSPTGPTGLSSNTKCPTPG